MNPRDSPDCRSRLTGCLLGTALGDALGLPAEGMSARAIERRFGRMDRFRLLGSTGFVSDDTEQSALVAQSLLRHCDDPAACAKDFRRALLGWFLRLPWGVGLSTIKACLRISVGIRRSGVNSGGNGAAMRACIIGVYFSHDSVKLEAFTRAISEVTHIHPLAVDGAVFTASLAAVRSDSSHTSDRADLVRRAVGGIQQQTLREAIMRAVALAEAESDVHSAALELGITGYVLHTVPFAAFCFMRFGDDPLEALIAAISVGGDTDSIAAILGGWLGALHGESALPRNLVDRIHDGPFGPTHLRALAAALAESASGSTAVPPSFSPAAALARNLVLFPVILAHGFRRILS